MNKYDLFVTVCEIICQCYFLYSLPPEMNSKDKQKRVKIFFLDDQQEWREYAVACLSLQGRTQKPGYDLKIILSKPLPSDRLTILPLMQLYHEEYSGIQIGLQMLSKIERLEDSLIAMKLEEWNRVLAFSFRDEDYCEAVLERIELEMTAFNKLPCESVQLLDYLSKEIDTNLQLVDWVFASEDNIAQFLEEAKTAKQESRQKQSFKIIKAMLNRADKSILEVFIKDGHFPGLLQCLSYNYEFGDRRIDYPQQYSRLAQCRNVLQLQDDMISFCYSRIMKVRFLWDVATSMFAQNNTLSLFNELITDCNFRIVKIFSQNSSYLLQFKLLAVANSEQFVELFSELWEMFKTIMPDPFTKQIKDNFYIEFVSENLLQITLDTVLDLAKKQTTHPRLFQKFLEACNPFLSYHWSQAQQMLTSCYQTGQVHIVQVLLSILNGGDYNTKNIVLLFARNLIEITENRPFMKQHFLNYMFNEFVSKSAPMFTTVEEIEIYIDFIIRLYKNDVIRTRRSIIQNNIISLLTPRVDNKYVLIALIKFLKSFLQNTNESIFNYLQRHQHFGFLRQKYCQMRSCRAKGLLSSLFSSLLKATSSSENKKGMKFIYNLMYPDETVS